MTTKTLRLPDDLITAVQTVEHAEHIEESTAMRKLMRMGFELYTARLYQTGQISLRQTAKRLDLSLSEALDVLQQLGVSGNVTADDTLASLRSLNL